MKTTLEISDALFSKAKLAAAAQGISFCELVSMALTDKLRERESDAKPWLTSFGKLRSLRSETARIDQVIKEEFGRIETEGWR
jgi:hypothetical protein